MLKPNLSIIISSALYLIQNIVLTNSFTNLRNLCEALFLIEKNSRIVEQNFTVMKCKVR